MILCSLDSLNNSEETVHLLRKCRITTGNNEYILYIIYCCIQLNNYNSFSDTYTNPNYLISINTIIDITISIEFNDNIIIGNIIGSYYIA
jgi:hypothetical protein